MGTRTGFRKGIRHRTAHMGNSSHILSESQPSTSRRQMTQEMELQDRGCLER